MKKNENSYTLCGGTFFTLLMQSRNPVNTRRERIQGQKERFNEQSVLTDLIKIVNSEFHDDWYKASIKTYTSDFKLCKKNLPHNWKLDDINVINNFFNELTNNYNCVYNKMNNLIYEYIDTTSNEISSLVKRFIEVILSDQNIGDYQFTIDKYGVSKNARELYKVDKIDLTAFLLSIWEYVIKNNINDNIIGRTTISLWMEAKEKHAQAKYIGPDGSSITQEIDIFFNYEKAVAPDQNNCSHINSEKQYSISSALHEYFNSIKNQGRYHGYIKQQHKIAKITNTFRVSHSVCSKTLDEIVFEHGNVNNVCVYGRGGCGKTFQLINLIESIFNSDSEKANIAPFYIPLNIFSNSLFSSNNLIIDHFKECIKKYKINDDDINNFFNCKEVYESKKPLFFLDGLNEITNPDIRQKIIMDIIYIRRQYSNIKIILTSRIDHSNTFIQYGDSGKFIKAHVEKLNFEQIRKYLAAIKSKININKLTYQQKELIKTPQGLVMFSEMYSNNSSIDIQNLGDLLDQYINSIVQLEDDDKEAMFDIAKTMVKNGDFKISVTSVKDMGYIINSNSNITTIFSKTNNIYEFSHQNFRDYFAARWLCNAILEISVNFSIDKFTNTFVNDNLFNEEILQLVSDIITYDDIKNVLLSLRNNKMGHPFALSKIIQIASLKTWDRDISFLNLDYFNLSEVCLSGYKLYSQNNHTSFNNSIISLNTFMNPGLQSASSTICKYELNNTLYLAIFSSTNIVVYDISNNIWKCYRNMPNMIWTHSCCKITINNKLFIVYGGRRLKMRVFEPTSGETYLILNANIDQNEIETAAICSIISLDNNDLVFFVSNGQIYHLNSSALPKNENKIYPTLIYTIPNFKEETAKHKCRLTTSKEYIYASAQNTIYRCAISDLKIAIQNNSFEGIFEKYIIYNPNSLIYDICFTDALLYANLGKTVNCINTYDNKQYESELIGAQDDDFKGFRKFFVESDGVVLCGVNSTTFNQCTNLYRFYIDENELITIPIAGFQKLIVHSCVNYIHNNIEHIASVSDDRSIQLIAPNNEDVEHVIFEGSYYGVHDLDLISDAEMIVAQYDGSISYWRKEFGQWKCNKVFPIHNRWVWSVKYYKPYIVSCSYDGTIKKTNIDTYETVVLLSLDPNDPNGNFLDFDIVLDEHSNISKIVAITAHYVYYKDFSSKIETTRQIQYNYTARAVRFNKNNTIIIAINGNNSSKLIRWDHNSFSDLIIANQECGFIRRFNIYNINGFEILVIAGNTNETINNAFNEYYAFYYNLNGSWSQIQINNHNKNIVNVGIPSPSFFIDTYPLTGTTVNDFAITKINLEGDFINFILVSVTKNQIFIYLLKFNTITRIINVSRVASILSDAQPMCIKVHDNGFYIGFLNGIIRDFYFIKENFEGCCQSLQLGEEIIKKDINLENSVISEKICIKTHPKLISDGKINLKNAKYADNTNSDEFKRDFDGYFKFTR